jgi:hypothetical protein
VIFSDIVGQCTRLACQAMRRTRPVASWQPTSHRCRHGMSLGAEKCSLPFGKRLLCAFHRPKNADDFLPFPPILKATARNRQKKLLLITMLGLLMHISKVRILQMVFAGTLATLLFATVGILLTPKYKSPSAPLTQSFTVIKKPQEGVHGIVAQRLFDLTVAIAPSPLLEDSDAAITIAVSQLHSPPPSGHVAVRVESDSFKIVPSESRNLDLVLGRQAQYVATPKGRGEKKVRVYAQYIEPIRRAGRGLLRIPIPQIPQAEYENIIGIEVQERPSFLGLSKEVLSALQVASVVVGLPSSGFKSV